MIVRTEYKWHFNWLYGPKAPIAQWIFDVTIFLNDEKKSVYISMTVPYDKHDSHNDILWALKEWIRVKMVEARNDVIAMHLHEHPSYEDDEPFLHEIKEISEKMFEASITLSTSITSDLKEFVKMIYPNSGEYPSIIGINKSSRTGNVKAFTI